MYLLMLVLCDKRGEGVFNLHPPPSLFWRPSIKMWGQTHTVLWVRLCLHLASISVLISGTHPISCLGRRCKVPSAPCLVGIPLTWPVSRARAMSMSYILASPTPPDPISDFRSSQVCGVNFQHWKRHRPIEMSLPR